MKTWFIIGLLVMAVGYPAEKQQNSTQKHQSEAKQAPPKSAVNPVTAPVRQPTAEIKQRCCDNDPKGVWEKATSPDTWPNWAVVIAALVATWVGIRTLRVIERQTKATEDAAKATQKSVELQEVLNQQWIEFENWIAANGGILTGTHNFALILSFEIVNTTKMPLALEGFEVNFNGQQTAFNHRNMLAPGRKYPVRIDTLLKGEKSESYGAGKCILPISGSVSYVDAFGAKRIQPFNLICHCGPSSSDFYNN